MSFHDASHQIWLAAMIYVLGAATSRRSVNRPVLVQREDIIERPRGADLGFLAADPLSRVFDYLAPRGNGFGRIDPPAMNLRLVDPK